MARDPEIWTRPATRASEPAPAWREALPARLLGLVLLGLVVYVIVEILIHIRIAGG